MATAPMGSASGGMSPLSTASPIPPAADPSENSSLRGREIGQRQSSVDHGRVVYAYRSAWLLKSLRVFANSFCCWRNLASFSFCISTAFFFFSFF